MVQALTTGMPQFYRALGWGVCGRQTLGQTLSRNLPQVNDVPVEGRAAWHVRPWRQVELNDLMALYDLQYARTTGSVVRSEDYWRWMIGRRYAHVIWVACQGEAVRGYAFVKDHKILEIASHPAHPQALRALLGRVRSEALERAYPEVIVHAPPTTRSWRSSAARARSSTRTSTTAWRRCTTSPTSTGSSRWRCPSCRAAPSRRAPRCPWSSA